MPPPTCVVICVSNMSSISSHMSSHDLINIPAKQTPVINRLSDALDHALAYSCAIRDNAQDDQQPIPMDLVASFKADYDKIIFALIEAA